MLMGCSYRRARMARLAHDYHLDAALRLILSSFQYAQEQGRLTDTEIAGTFLGLLGQLECSSQLTPARAAPLPGDLCAGGPPQDRRPSRSTSAGLSGAAA